MVNTVLTFVVLIVAFLALIFLYFKRSRETKEVDYASINSLDKLLDVVKKEMNSITKEDNLAGVADEDFENSYRRKARITEAMRDCAYGIEPAKLVVQDLICCIIAEKLPTEEDILNVVDFHSRFLDPRIKFEIILYNYRKTYGKDALATILKKYNLLNERYEIEDRKMPSYIITEDDVNSIYAKENEYVGYKTMLDILTILIYQQYKGFGLIDTIRDMNINGINIGTSGSILQQQSTDDIKVVSNLNCVWLFFSGKYIHLRFLKFKSEEEIRRVVQLITRYNSPGQLSAKRGYMVNTMYDKSRTLCLCPPASEQWAAFIRKFTISNPSLEYLIIKEYTRCPEIPMMLLQLIMLGQVTTGFTGRQGSGKTTMMTSVVRHISPMFNIRILEMAPEMYLRELYPERNILSVQQTDTVSATELQDALKKSDAAVSAVGEVATDELALKMIQFAMTASIFSIFSHHANTPPDLVYTLRNSLVNAGGFSNMATAEKQVIDAVHLDVHLDFTPDGRRFIHRISEIVPLPEGVPYPEYDENDPVHSMNRITREYYTRQTDRVTFEVRDIMHYDIDTNTYYTADWFSDNLWKHMYTNLPENRKLEFLAFAKEHWPGKVIDPRVA